ncbi:MAG TPA: DNA double-strand break repair nuclease NurA [Candidatus Babeliales bacterium]|nr:DNA double-strand break repair nuclease NurA [Candidatus Babeliales bacterium]
MLDRLKLVGQISKVSGDLFNNLAHELEIARQAWDKIIADPDFNAQILQAKSPWVLPSWDKNLNLAHKAKINNLKNNHQVAVQASNQNINPNINQAAKPAHKQHLIADPNINNSVRDYTVISTDGSQVYPDRQMGTNCFLLNIGTVILNYSSTAKSSVQLFSEPTIYTGSSDLDSLSLVELVDCKRQELELQAGLEAVGKIVAPVKLFLIDGALIFWQLENSKSSGAKKIFWDKYLAILHALSERKIWFAGYISLPNSKELVNLLRMSLCDLKPSLQNKPKILNFINDVHVASFYLQAFEYSIVFKNQTEISKLYPANLQPHFVYFNTGTEIARIEFPAWIAQDLNLVEQIMSLVADQVIKGRGYPVVLSEAHEQAVVHHSDREFFYQLLDQAGSKHGQQLTISRKLLRKKFIGI